MARALDIQPTVGHLGVTNENLTFGTLDADGKTIVGGKYLIRVRVNLGRAPLASLSVALGDPTDPTVWKYIEATKDHPTVEGLDTINLPGGLTPGDLLGMNHGTAVADQTALIGATGQATIAFALVNSPRQTLRQGIGMRPRMRSPEVPRHAVYRDRNPADCSADRA